MSFKPNDFKHMVKLNNSHKVNITEVIEWCNTCIGAENKAWYWSYSNESPFDYTIHFYFKSPDDSAFFILKWS